VYAEVKTVLLSPDKTTLFIGGIFNGVNGATRHLVAALNTANRNLNNAWNPDITQAQPWGSGGPGLNGPPCPPRCYPTVFVMKLAPDGQSIYVGGTFAFVGTVSRNSAARVTVASGALLAWDPNVYYSATTKGSQNSVYDLAQVGSRVYLCGDFWRVGSDTPSGTATNIASVDATTGVRDTNFVTSTDGAVNTCTASGNEVFIGGHFDVVGGAQQGIGGDTRHHIAALDPSTGANDPWNPGANSIHGLYAMNWTPARLGVGGEFTIIGGVGQEGFAQFSNP
jgi:hypothetical protein